MNDKDRSIVLTNYYRASKALMLIGIIDNIPDELKQITVKASAATERIIDYVNKHRD
jgi:hypothetical protein